MDLVLRHHSHPTQTSVPAKKWILSVCPGGVLEPVLGGTYSPRIKMNSNIYTKFLKMNSHICTKNLNREINQHSNISLKIWNPFYTQITKKDIYKYMHQHGKIITPISAVPSTQNIQSIGNLLILGVFKFQNFIKCKNNIIM